MKNKRNVKKDNREEWKEIIIDILKDDYVRGYLDGVNDSIKYLKREKINHEEK
jgi:hypothetical protein